ncbi:MAG: PBP1A family penicillin-binding protein [Patescibacteria group bacterium]|nr:PBP1A family penicillin-binding protein [Patescibacteria group bacterium]
MSNWKRTWRKRVNKLKYYTKKYRPRSKADLIKLLAVLGFFGILGMSLLGTIMFAWYAKDLPTPDKVVRRDGFSTKIFDRNGQLLYDVFADQRRTPVELEKIPETLKQATIAIEDKNFYEHKGFDPLGWVRAVFNTIFKLRRLGGGSTLTQQLVKNVLLTNQRSISRKIKEFVLSVQIEKKYTKDEILKMYLNESPYGGTAWGVQAACETYFAKDVDELNLIESAVLAGLPQAPSRYSPFIGGDGYKNRTKSVLRRMREDDYISKDEEKQALEDLDKIEFAPEGSSFKAPHFVMYVKSKLIERYGEALVEQGGLRVTTSLDWDLQKEAQKIITEEIEKVESLHITNGASLTLDSQTGEILSMVGSKNYSAEDYDGKVNVTLSLRQPGSSIKPVNYVTAFMKGYTPATMIADVLTEFPGGANIPVYKPKNYDGKFRGPVQLRYALGNSLNIPAVKLLQLVGVKEMLETAYKMGFTSLEPTRANVNRFGLSLTLGGGEVRLIDMTAAYSAFANGGYKVEPISILKVEDNKGKVLEEYKASRLPRVLTEEQAFLISNILSDNSARLITFGANSFLRIPGHTVAVKTGTTDDMRDNWAVGWTPAIITAVWVGNNDNTPMKKVASGISGATPIWRETIIKALSLSSVKDWGVPKGIIEMEVDSISGYASHDGWPSRKEYFIKGTEPISLDLIHTKLKICKGQEDKLASKIRVAKGDYEEKEYIVLKADDPAGGSKNRWQEGIDAWINGQDDSRYKYPKDYCDDDNGIYIQITSPGDHDTVDNDFDFKAKVTSGKEIKWVKFYIDGVERKEIFSKPFEYREESLEDGTYTLKVKTEDVDGNVAEKEIKIGVNQDWDYEEPEPSPSPLPTPSLSPSPLPSSE